jgi:hypothetical protein
MKTVSVGIVEIVDNKPVIVRIVDYIANELNSNGDYDMIINDQTLLAESKRLNDEMRYCLEAQNI